MVLAQEENFLLTAGDFVTLMSEREQLSITITIVLRPTLSFVIL